jgi:hypothetical protein
LAKYEGRVDLLRRYWISAFTADVTDVFVMECDDLMDAHSLNQELNEALSEGGDPERFGKTVTIWAGSKSRRLVVNGMSNRQNEDSK